ncbi:hypothetical protein CTAYLR_009587 [Chrysophaeum taylorii]|uniref:MYND-type domain-containing protein n=1 Tax=Chrysophaeum taylorii TaxID=2483200 RepID=A0AAD7U849_9STRA|nr:hypothetical protein CTAYLR_009587 [Chrysophaeum taylorii]
MMVCASCASPGRLRCSRCRSVGYCSKRCQEVAWRTHKVVCGRAAEFAKVVSPAIARARAKCPLPPQSDASCFVCLEGGGWHGRCACRGENGFVHVECLSRVAASSASLGAWTTCGTCHQHFVGRVGLELAVAMWRRHGDWDRVEPWCVAVVNLATRLRAHGEVEAALEALRAAYARVREAAPRSNLPWLVRDMIAECVATFDPERAVVLLETQLALKRRLFGDDDTNSAVFDAKHRLAQVLCGFPARRDEGIALMRGALDGSTELEQKKHSLAHLAARSTLARLLLLAKPGEEEEGGTDAEAEEDSRGGPRPHKGRRPPP